MHHNVEKRKIMWNSFEIWLKKELEKANHDGLSTDTWPRKNGQERSDKIAGTLKLLAEFRAIYKDQKPD